LLLVDGLITPTVGLYFLSLFLVKAYFNLNKADRQFSYIDFFGLSNLFEVKNKSPSLTQTLAIYGFYSSVIVQAILLFGLMYIVPPTNLPYLFPMLISAFSCCHFLLFLVYFNYKQFTVNRNVAKLKLK
jgi:alpha-1,3-glucosyltransferase